MNPQDPRWKQSSAVKTGADDLGGAIADARMDVYTVKDAVMEYEQEAEALSGLLNGLLGLLDRVDKASQGEEGVPVNLDVEGKVALYTRQFKQFKKRADSKVSFVQKTLDDLVKSCEKVSAKSSP